MNGAMILEQMVIVVDLGDICQDGDKDDGIYNQPKIYHKVYPIRSIYKLQVATRRNYRKKKKKDQLI